MPLLVGSDWCLWNATCKDLETYAPWPCDSNDIQCNKRYIYFAGLVSTIQLKPAFWCSGWNKTLSQNEWKDYAVDCEPVALMLLCMPSTLFWSMPVNLFFALYHWNWTWTACYLKRTSVSTCQHFRACDYTIVIWPSDLEHTKLKFPCNELNTHARNLYTHAAQWQSHLSGNVSLVILVGI